MDYELIALVGRQLERLLIVAAGATSIWLGYRTFLAIPRQKREGEAKLGLPGGVSIYVTRVGPGIFFALFGAVVLGIGLRHGLTLESEDGGSTVLSRPTETRRLSLAVQESPAGERKDTERGGTLDTVRQLARLAEAMESNAMNLPAEKAVDYVGALTDARLRLLAGVWDEERWGDRAEFSAWINGGQTGDPPARARAPARAFTGEP